MVSGRSESRSAGGKEKYTNDKYKRDRKRRTNRRMRKNKNEDD